VIENFIEIKCLKKILERLKRKVDIFIGTKNILNPILYIALHFTGWENQIVHVHLL